MAAGGGVKGSEGCMSGDHMCDQRCAIRDPELGQAKGNALRTLLGDHQRQQVSPVAVVVRSVSARMGVTRWPANEGRDCPVLLPANVAENGFLPTADMHSVAWLRQLRQGRPKVLGTSDPSCRVSFRSPVVVLGSDKSSATAKWYAA
jgi:hypothetical protein